MAKAPSPQPICRLRNGTGQKLVVFQRLLQCDPHRLVGLDVRCHCDFVNITLGMTAHMFGLGSNMTAHVDG